MLKPIPDVDLIQNLEIGRLVEDGIVSRHYVVRIGNHGAIL